MMWYIPAVGKGNSEVFSQFLGCLGLHSLLYFHVLFFLQEVQESWGHEESVKGNDHQFPSFTPLLICKMNHHENNTWNSIYIMHIPNIFWNMPWLKLKCEVYTAKDLPLCQEQLPCAAFPQWTSNVNWKEKVFSCIENFPTLLHLET